MNKKIGTLLVIAISLSIFWFSLIWLKVIRAQGQVQLYFSPESANLPPDTAFSLVLESSESIGFVRVRINFDQTKINLVQEIVTTPLLATRVEVTDMAEANSTGTALVVLGLSPTDSAPTGSFEVAGFTFTSITEQPNQSSELAVADADSQVVDASASELSIFSSSASVVLNFTPTPTPSPSPTQVPEPSPSVSPGVSPTPTLVPTAAPDPAGPPSASLSFVGDSYAFVGEETAIGISFETNVPVSGVDAVVLYDTAELGIVRVDDKKLLSDTTIVNIDDGGTVRISQLESPGLGFSGSGVIADLIVRPLTSGLKNLVFEHEPFNDADSNVVEASTGNDILGSVGNLNFDAVEHPIIALQLLTPSESAVFGHSVNGNLQESGGVWTENFLTDISGLAEIKAPDSYLGKFVEAVFKVTGFLRKRRSFTVGSGENRIEIGVLTAGDLNDDGIVNNIDLSLMYDSWFGSGGADYNRDGIVNSIDHWILTKNFFAQDE